MIENQNKKLIYNTISSFIYQITGLICGFILPQFILRAYGSETNGLVNSITQFLSFIAFLEAGVGAVVKSALYKPLAETDHVKTSEIITSADRFFKGLAVILIVYIVVLTIFYPLLFATGFSWLYSAELIIAIGLSSFAQYYIGIVDRLLLTADQRGYIQYIACSISLIVNTVVCVILIRVGASIQIVKFATLLIYVVRPLALRVYVNKNYSLNRNIKYSKEPLSQKWNGIAQHIAAIVMDGTDTVVLTVMSTLSNVSVYSVYHLVIYGIKQMFMALLQGFESLLGELYVRDKRDELNNTFSWFEWIVHTGAVFIFGCTIVLIVPFVQVYTSGITDVDYIQPTFAFLLVLANAIHCLRLPYTTMILAANKYRETQLFFIIGAATNVIVSIIMVRIFGLIGVAVGTLAAMLLHTFWMTYFTAQKILCIKKEKIFKQYAVDVLSLILGIFLCNCLKLRSVTVRDWIIMGLFTAVIWFADVIIMNLLFYNCNVKKILKKAIAYNEKGKKNI